MIRRFLNAPVDGAPLIWFRMAFGAVALADVLSFVARGDIHRYFVAPAHHLTYYGFNWVRPLPAAGMYLLFGFMAALAAFIAVGFITRISAFLFFLGFSYVFLIDQVLYLNHHYLICLLALLLVVVPTNGEASVDAVLRPGIRTRVVPLWALRLLQLQIAIPYVCGGIAKFDADWLSALTPRIWLSVAAMTGKIPIAASGLLGGYLMAYGGLLFDLLIVPLLFWRRTRIVAIVAVVIFHLANARLFNIGIFPWLMIPATIILLRPDGLPAAAPWRKKRPAPALSHSLTFSLRNGGMAVLATYVAFQLIFPFRHLLYPGNANWTGEGQMFAWRMMLRQRSVTAHFFVDDLKRRERWEIEERRLLAPWQWNEVADNPDMIVQFAHLAAEELRRNGMKDFQIRADIQVSLNARSPQPLVDPKVDLAAQRRRLGHAEWLLPYDPAHR